MSFEFTVLPDERFIEILEAWVDSPWPKTAEDGYALRDRFGWTQKEGKPNVFTSDVHPIGFPCYFTKGSGSIGTFSFLITDIAPEGARGGGFVEGCSGDLSAFLRHSEEPVR